MQRQAIEGKTGLVGKPFGIDLRAFEMIGKLLQPPDDLVRAGHLRPVISTRQNVTLLRMITLRSSSKATPNDTIGF